MSGFGQNAQNASAFTFPSLNQTGASTAAPGFTFGAPKTTVATAVVSSTPAFGTTASIGIKSNVGLIATPTCTSLPTLGVPQSTASGTIFGSSWPGMFSAGGGTEVAAPTTASAPSLAPVTTAAVKSSPFTFGTPGIASTTPQSQGLASTPIVASSSAPTLPVAATVTQTSTPASLSFTFGAAPPTAITTAAPTLGLNLPMFGAAAATAKLQSTTVSTTPVTTTSTAAATSLKLSISTSTPLTAASKTTTIASGLTLFSTPSTSVAPTTTATVPAVSAASTSLAPTASSNTNASGTTTAATSGEEEVMTYSKLQENINKWAMELEKQEKIFLHQATEMNGWDRVIVENSDKLHMLNAKIEKVRKEQRHLDLELDFVLSQQNELDYMLKGLEKEWGSVPPSDPERQHTYKIAESLDYKLKLMSEDLKEVVDHMNAMNYPPNDEFNPVMQIVRILNAHMNVLLMVERKTNLAESKVKEVGKVLELCKRDYDRACHLYFD